MKKYFILDFKLPVSIHHKIILILSCFIILFSTSLYARYNHITYPILSIISVIGVILMINFFYITRRYKEYFSVQRRYRIYAINQVIGFLILAIILLLVYGTGPLDYRKLIHFN